MASALVFLVWYPAPYDVAQGVSQLVLIMIGVDVALGPLITAVVFNPAKKSLKFDLAVVAVVQLGALLYGMHAIWGGRPAYLVFAVDRFELVPIHDVDEASLAKADSAFHPRLGLPPTFAARIPTDIETRNALMFESGMGGPDLAQRPEFFVPLADANAEVKKQIRPVDELRRLNHLDDEAWRALLADIARDPATIGYLPMSAKARDGAVLMDLNTGEILGIRMLTPSYGSLGEESPLASVSSGVAT